MTRHAKRLLVCFLALGLGPGTARADKFAGAFLSGGAGARALGMGNAFTAVANDASGIYWNPAGLASTTENELLLSHEFRFGDLVDYSFGGGIYQVRQRDGRLGFGVVRLAIDNIAFPDSSLWTDSNHNGRIDPGEFDYDEVRDASKVKFANDAEYAFFLSYAQPVGSNQVGGSLKLIHQSVGLPGQKFTSFGLGLDLGYLRRNGPPWPHWAWLRNLDFGLTLHDLTGTYLSWSTGRKETIAPVPRLGLAYTLPSTRLRGSFLLTADADLHLDNRQGADQLWVGRTSANLDWGLEFTMQNRLALRLGLSESDFQAGAGLVAGPFAFDYAVVPDAQDFDLSQRFSVRYLHRRQPAPFRSGAAGTR